MKKLFFSYTTNDEERKDYPISKRGTKLVEETVVQKEINYTDLSSMGLKGRNQIQIKKLALFIV